MHIAALADKAFAAGKHVALFKVIRRFTFGKAEAFAMSAGGKQPCANEKGEAERR
jgi:hypothetical protein